MPPCQVIGISQPGEVTGSAAIGHVRPRVDHPITVITECDEGGIVDMITIEPARYWIVSKNDTQSRGAVTVANIASEVLTIRGCGQTNGIKGDNPVPHRVEEIVNPILVIDRPLVRSFVILITSGP